MQEAALPQNEVSRLATLHSLDILDTPREDRFDRYTRITAKAFGTPIALISLVDRDRQWFKSAKGLDNEETPREISFCGHAILGDGVFEVRDARRDPRFRDNPLVLGPPHIRFYAGAPLETPDGHKLGTLCLIDSVPRQLSDDEKTMLKNLADIVIGDLMRNLSTQAAHSMSAPQTITGSRFFDSIPDEHGLSVLLFDIDDVLESHDEVNPGMSPGDIFAQLLHDHFPTAPTIAHIGNYHYCVLLEPDKAFDEIRAINRLCSDARKLLCFAEGHQYLAPFVGRLQYNSNKYASVSDMLCDADSMFLRHEREALPTKANTGQFLKSLVGWRKTIF